MKGLGFESRRGELVKTDFLNWIQQGKLRPVTGEQRGVPQTWRVMTVQKQDSLKRTMDPLVEKSLGEGLVLS